jgi:hypothetical protein
VRGVLTVASRLQPGDVVFDGSVKTVRRVMGVQGRKPTKAAPLMRVVFDDDDVATVREDAPIRMAPRA